MRKSYLLPLLLLFTAVFYLACKKGDDNPPANPCAGVTVAVTATIANATTGVSNGSITAAATGGSGFTFSLNNGAFQNSGTFPNLAAGTYTVTAKNSNGCTGSQQFTVGSNNPCAGVTISITGTITNATTGQSNGSIVASATGGTNFTYSLNNGAFQASGTFSSLAAGNYTITAKNGDGCTASQQFTVGSTNPCAGVTVTVTATITNATNNQSNGSIVATAAGGSGFTYNINNGTFQSSGTFSNLAPGNYTITAKNSAGCTGSQQFTVGNTNTCGSFSATATTTAAVPCGGPGGSIQVSATGSSGYTYSLNNGATQSNPTFGNVAAGNHVVTVKDVNNCTTTVNVSVGTASAGPLFSAVRTIIQNNCTSCHNASNPSGGMNWAVDCNIVNFKNSIKARSVDAAGTGSQMPPPPSPPLSAADRQKITEWINAGGGFNH